MLLFFELLLFWFGSWIVGYAIFFLIFKTIGEHEKYNYPGFFFKTSWISAFFSLIMFTAIQMFRLLPFGEMFELINAFSCLSSVILAVFTALSFLMNIRKPKHNQDESVSVLLHGNVSELKEISSIKFPDIPADQIRLFRTSENVENESFSILPISKWKNKDEIVVHPMVTVGHIEHLAKQKDPTLKKVSVHYHHGIPFLFYEK